MIKYILVSVCLLACFSIKAQPLLLDEDDTGVCFSVDPEDDNGDLDDGTDDAFDGYGELYIDGDEFDTDTDLFVPPNATLGPETYSGLEVTRQIYAYVGPNCESITRYIECFTNNTAAPITVDIVIEGDLGSDSRTQIEATSSGDLIGTSDDFWVTSSEEGDDWNDGDSDPPLAFNLHGPGSSLPLASMFFENEDDDLAFTFMPLTVEPGQTCYIMHFVTQAQTKADALAMAMALNTPDEAALVGADISRIKNYIFDIDFSAVATCINAGQDQFYIEAEVTTPSLTDIIISAGGTSSTIAAGSLSTTVGPVSYINGLIEVNANYAGAPLSGSTIQVQGLVCGLTPISGVLHGPGFFCEDQGSLNAPAVLSQFEPKLVSTDNPLVTEYFYVALDNLNNIIEVNQSGLFENLPLLSSYTIYGFHVSIEDSATFSAELAALGSGSLSPAINASGNFSGLCYSAAPFEYEPEDYSGPLACNNQVQVSLDENCEVEVTSDMILEGSYGCAAFLIEIEGVSGSVLRETGTYTVTVQNMETGNQCWGTIIVEDKLAPDIECQDITISCGQAIPEDPGIPVMDNCYGENVFLDFYDTTVTDGAFCGNTVIIRTWTATDGFGNTDSCPQKITITPISIEDVNAPEEVVELPCGSGTSMPEIEAYFGGKPTGTKYAYPWLEDYTGIVALAPSICNIGATKTDTPIAGLCEGDRKVIRLWTVLDWCRPELGVTTYSQVIKVVDHEDPYIDISVLNQDITVSTDPWGCAVDFNPPVPEHLSDNCSEPTYRIEVEGGHDLNALPKGWWTLTYIASDDCDNTSTDEITVHVKDETPPVAIAKQNIVISLTSSSTDGQGIAKLYWQSIDNGSYDGCTEELYYEIRRADGEERDCENFTGPCNVIGNNTFSNRDGNSDHPYCRRDTEDGGQYVKFCCADITDVDDNGIGYGLVDVILRVWDDGDCDENVGEVGEDNYNDTWATIRVENKLPIQIQCPDDVTIDCFEDPEDTRLTGVATGTGTCDGLEATPEYDYSNVNQCGGPDGDALRDGYVVITWTISSNGQTEECEQRVYVVAEDPFNYHDISWPGDIETDCKTPDAGEPSWNEVPCSLVGSSMDQQVFEFEEDACYKELNHWTIIDWCAYDPLDYPTPEDDDYHELFDGTYDYELGSPRGIWTHTQIVKVIDTSKPVLECVDQPEWATEDCLAQNVELTNSATDEGSDCPSPWLKWEVCLDINYDWTCDHIWTSDEGMATQSRTDIYYYVAPSGSGEEITLPVGGSFNEPDELDLPIGTHRVLWTVNDGCGNVSACTQFINVTDGKAPTPYCIQNLSTAVMDHGGTVEIWASDFNLASTDNCTTDPDDLLYSFSGTSYVPSREFECDELEGEAFKIFDLEMWVWDEAGNADFCFVQLRINDNGVCGGGDGRAAISGLLTTESGDLVDQTNVSLNSALPEFPIEQMVDGEYAFVENPMYNSYEVTAEKNDNYLNGVSTLDLVLIQKHILGLQLLNSPYKVIAADINSDQGVSALDLVELRKLILGIIEELPNNNSWRFVDASQAFADVNQPWPFTETLAIDNLLADMMAEDFVAAKIGDVSGDAQANLTSGNTEIRTNASLNLSTTDRSYTAGDVVRVDITSDEFNDVYGYQFTMNYTGLEYAGVEAGALALTADNFGLHRTNEGMISTSWARSESVSTSDVLFSVLFTATANGKLSESISIGSAITPAEAYRGSGLSVENVSIEFRTDNGSVSGVEYVLYQNEPNPFASATVIGFELPRASEATISVYDVTGKVIKVVRGDYAKGYNEVSLERNELNSAGVLYYQLASGEYTATKKMILID